MIMQIFTSTARNLVTKEEIKKLPHKKRISYFCDYYLAKCLVDALP